MKAILAGSALLLLIFFQCCPSTNGEPSPADTSETEIVWEVEVPEGLVRTLFTEEVLTDESCLDCVIGDLERATKLEPRWRGCERAKWDPGFSYCHVKVLTGDLAGKVGWVNIDCIEKAP